MAESDTAALLQRYRPVIQYDSQESFYADSAATITDLVVTQPGKPTRSNYLKHGDRTIVAAGAPTAGQAQLDLDFLTGAEYRGGRGAASRDDFLDETGRDYVADSARMHLRPGLGDQIYGHAARDRRGRIWLQYWFFYYYNDKALFGVGVHEGDWEMIQIRLDSKNKPNVATYAQHRQGERASWTDVERETTPDGPVPVVYSARGSHASYYRPGTYPEAPVVPDHNDAGGPRVRPAVAVISDETPSWAQWPGHWGSTPKRNFIESDSPRGPHEHSQWRDPDRFHADARPHEQLLLPRGAERALAVRLAPPTPRIVARREGGRAVIDYRFPKPTLGQPPPVGILATLDARDDPRPPASYVFPVIGLVGSIEHPLELEDRDYRVRVRAFSQAGLETGVVTKPLPLGQSVPAVSGG